MVRVRDHLASLLRAVLVLNGTARPAAAAWTAGSGGVDGRLRGPRAERYERGPVEVGDGE